MSKEMNAREFMNTMERLINSTNQKLIGDMRGGAKNKLDTLKHTMNNTFGVASMYRQQMMFEIKKVIFNNPATIVFWADGTKTVVKAEDENFDPEKSLAMAIAKKALGNKGSYFNKIKRWTNDYNEGD